MEFWQRVERELAHRKTNESYRELKLIEAKTDFASNDYLGLARSQKLAQSIHQKAQSLGIGNGATGSRLLSGNHSLIEALEEKLGILFRGQALLYNSGYDANIGVLSCLPQRNDTILYDELAHACIKDGARLSLAKRYSFRHNDIHDLENKLRKASGQTFIVVESIYSMDGDECPLREILALKKKYNSIVMIDEAHSTGVMGENGSGMSCLLNLEKDIDIRVYTFGKAMGTHGACVVTVPTIKNYLINFSRSFIYTTALSPHSIISIECAFDFLRQYPALQTQLRDRILLFQNLLHPNAHRVPSKSAIQSILVIGNKAAKMLSSKLLDQGLDCRPILAPTVKEGSERLRICLHTFNTNEELEKLVLILNQYNS